MKKILALVIDDEEDIRDVVADKLAAILKSFSKRR